MTRSVNLYLASCVIDGVGFWLINFTEEEDILNSLDSNFLECYRKELFGLEAAIEVKEAINTTLDILSLDSGIDCFKLDDIYSAYSFDIPLYCVENIFDLWAYNYNNKILWKKYIGLLNLRKKIKNNNNYINLGLKGDTYEFAIKLNQLLRFRPLNRSIRLHRSYKSMW